MLQLSQSGDVIQIIATGTETSPLDLCPLIPIEHDLLIEGILGTPIIQCTAVNATIVSIQGGTMRLKNLRIATGVIQTKDAELIVESCTFDEDARVHGMSMNSMILHEYYARLYSYQFITDTISNATKSNVKDPRACYQTDISLIDCKWNSRKGDNPVYVDTFPQEGLHVICKEVNILVENTHFSDTTVYIVALTGLQVNFTNSKFTGKETGSDYVSGVVIETFPSLPNPKVTVENCTFANLQFDQTIFEIAWNYKDIGVSAAISIRVIKGEIFEQNWEKNIKEFTKVVQNETNEEPNNSFKNIDDINENLDEFANNSSVTREYSVNIINSTFENNSRAIAMEYDPDIYRPSLFIFNSKFSNNTVKLNGGAIYVSGLSYMEINSCEFTNNSAGANVVPIQKVENFNYTLAKSFHFVIKEYSVFQDRFQLIYEKTDGDFDSGFEAGIGSKELTGEGGALYIQDSYCEIHNSWFSDNIAFKYGGTIYGSSSAHVGVYNSVFNNTKRHEIIDGTMIKTYGTLILINNSFVEGYASSKLISTIHHFNEASKETAWLSNITLQCPQNSLLFMFNVSGDMFSNKYGRPHVLGYKKLSYSCLTCAWGNYSLHSGYLDVPDISNITHQVSKIVYISILIHHTIISPFSNYTSESTILIHYIFPTKMFSTSQFVVQ